jgi:hypothetical protein
MPTKDEIIAKLQADVASLQGDVRMLLEVMEAKKIQQLEFPVDDASKAALGVPLFNGPGSTGLTETRNLTGNAQSITVPKAYTGTIIIQIEGGLYEIPYL